jgi:hypothetical protein
MLQYRDLTEQVRAEVERATPAGARVLVVSRGDCRLTDLEGRVGLHYPQDPCGGYAGHHPAGGAEAIEQLEQLRTAGADYLVFPATAWWWFKHYEGLADHLHDTTTLAVDSPHCQIFALG